MKPSNVTTPISDAARYFSSRENEVIQSRNKKAKTERFVYPSFEHVHHRNQGRQW